MTDVTDSDLDGEATGDEGLSDEKGQRLVPANKVSEIVSKRVNEVRAESAEERQRMQRQIDELAAKVAAPAKKPDTVYSREQLAAAVGDGKLTQSQANAIWDRQQQNSVQQTAADTAAAIVEQRDRENRLQATINLYTEKFPDIAKAGTADRQKIAEEVAVQQREFGLKGLEAEVAALRVVFGRESSLKFDTRERGRQPHQESVGGGNGSDGGKGADPDMPKNLTARERKYYEDRIERGLYKGWKDVKEELKYADQNRRTRAAARG